MNWYRYVYSNKQEDYLRSLGATDDIVQYILSTSNPQFYINEFRKNPQLTLPELQSIEITQQKQRETSIYDQLLNAAFKMHRSPEYGKWVVIQLRKMLQLRGQKLDQEKFETLRSIVRREHIWGRKISEIEDWYNYNIEQEAPFNIWNYSYEQAVPASDEWHKMMAEKGSGKIYEKTDPERIVYGPVWKDPETGEDIPEYRGWTIQEVKSENDLLVEGNLMKNCIGDYCDQVESGESIIFSLRDPTNKPHVSIEFDSTGKYVEQIQGNSNQEPDVKYKKMIKTWTGNRPGDIYSGEEENVTDIGYSEDTEDINNRLEAIISGPQGNEYGFKLDIDININAFERIIYLDKRSKTGYSSRYGDYSGNIRETPKLFVDALLAKHGQEIIPQFENELSVYENGKDVDFNKNWEWENIGDTPNEEDFETIEEYQKAYNEWEEQEQEYEGEAMDEARGKWLPWGFIDDTFKYIAELREKGKIQPYKAPEIVRASINKKAQIRTVPAESPQGSFFLIDGKLHIFNVYDGHTEWLRERFGVNDFEAHCLRYAFPRGRASFTLPDSNLIIEASKELDLYKTQIIRELGIKFSHNPKWNSENSMHYNVTTDSLEKLLSLKIPISSALIKVIHNYFPQLLKLVIRANNWYQLLKTSQGDEWWIDDSGSVYFADGDVGDYNHAMVAFEAALGISLDDLDAPQMAVMEPLSQEAIEWLLAQGAPTEAVEALKGGSDPRDYAVNHMGWKRLEGNIIETKTLTSSDLDIIVRGLWDIYGEDVKNMEDFTIHVNATGQIYRGIPYSVIERADFSALRQSTIDRRY